MFYLNSLFLIITKLSFPKIINPKPKPVPIVTPTATFCIGMTEGEFIRKNLDIEKTDYIGETDKLGRYSTYIGNSGKYKFIVGIEIPHLRIQYFTFAFKNDTLDAVYRGRNNFNPNREIGNNEYCD